MAEGDSSSSDITAALKVVLRNSLKHSGLLRGLREVAKTLDCGKAQLCVLASSCDEPQYVKLVEALCAHHGVPLLKVKDNKMLGEMAGLCKLDRDGQPRKVVGCSCLVVSDFGEDSAEIDILSQHLNVQFPGRRAAAPEADPAEA